MVSPVGTPSHQDDKSRLRGLDGIRALAVIAVVAFHFSPDSVPGGFLGVDIFFALSGYLITRLLLNEIARTGRLSFGRFYVRRARRLLPAAFTVIGVVGLSAALFWRDELQILRGAISSSLGYVTNWWQIYAHESYFVSSGRPSMLQHLWSLAIEEQFYLIWPLLLALVLGLVALRHREDDHYELTTRRLGLLAGVAALLALASTAAMTAIAVSTDVPYRADSNRVYFGTDTHSMGLLLGAAVAALVMCHEVRVSSRVRHRPRTLALTDLAGIGALTALIVMIMHVDEFSRSLYRGGFLLVSAFAVVLVSATARRGSLLGWALDWAPLRWLGQRSYAIYLWHWPIAVVTRPGLDIHWPGWAILALRTVLTLGLASSSYALIERPVRAAGWSGLLRTWRINPARGRAVRRLLPIGIAASFALIVLNVATSGLPSLPLAARPVSHVGAPPIEMSPTIGGPDVPLPRPSAPSGTSLASTSAAAPSASPRKASQPPRPARPLDVTAAFGDSVMVGAQAYLQQVFPGIKVSAHEGQQPWVTLGKVAASQQAHDPGAIVIIHTGDNGVIPPDQLGSVLKSLSRAKKIFILNDRVPRDWQGPNNSTLRSVVPRYHNAVLLDWYHESGEHPNWLYSDGIHLRPDGASGYTNFVAAGVRRHLA